MIYRYIICWLLLIPVMGVTVGVAQTPLTPPYREWRIENNTSLVLAWSPGTETSPILAVAGDQLWLWDVVADKLLLEVTLPDASTSLAWSQDGQQLLLATRTGQLWLWEAKSNVVSAVGTYPDWQIAKLWPSASPNDWYWLASASADSAQTPTLIRWNARQDDITLQQALPVLPSITTSSLWSIDPEILLLGEDIGRVTLWEIETGQTRLQLVNEDTGMILGLDGNSDGTALLVTPIGSPSVVYSSTGQILQTYASPPEDNPLVQDGVWYAEQTQVLAAANTSQGASVYRWDAASGELLDEFEVGQVLFETFQVHSSGLASAIQADDGDSWLRVWKVE